MFEVSVCYHTVQPQGQRLVECEYILFMVKVKVIHDNIRYHQNISTVSPRFCLVSL